VYEDQTQCNDPEIHDASYTLSPGTSSMCRLYMLTCSIR